MNCCGEGATGRATRRQTAGERCIKRHEALVVVTFHAEVGGAVPIGDVSHPVPSLLVRAPVTARKA
jgi:hypothetical protein